MILQAVLCLIMTNDTGKHLIEKLMGMKSDSDQFNEMELSALREVGNTLHGILSGIPCL